MFTSGKGWIIRESHRWVRKYMTRKQRGLSHRWFPTLGPQTQWIIILGVSVLTENSVGRQVHNPGLGGPKRSTWISDACWRALSIDASFGDAARALPELDRWYTGKRQRLSRRNQNRRSHPVIIHTLLFFFPQFETLHWEDKAKEGTLSHSMLLSEGRRAGTSCPFLFYCYG